MGEKLLHHIYDLRLGHRVSCICTPSTLGFGKEGKFSGQGGLGKSGINILKLHFDMCGGGKSKVTRNEAWVSRG